MSVENCSPYSIMAVTFTKQSGGGDASSYRATDGHQPGRHVSAPSTGWRTRLLRAHHMDANLPQDFQILDSEESAAPACV